MLKGFNKFFKLCIAMFSCFNISNIYSADSENSQISLSFKIKSGWLSPDVYPDFNIKFKLKVNDKYIDDCWKDYLNGSINRFFKSKDYIFVLDDDLWANIDNDIIAKYFKNGDDGLDIDKIKNDIISKYREDDNNIELNEEYNLNITNFTLQCFEKKDENIKKIEKSNTISDGLNKMLNDYKTNINEFFSVITDKKKSWSQFIQNIKLRLSGTDNKLTMEIKLYLDFPKSDNILITYKDPVEDIKEEVLKDFYKKIDNCKSFDEKINAYSNYKLDKEFFSAKGSFLNLTIVNKSDIEINSLKITKEIDSFYDCDELLNIYKQFKRGELSPLFIFKEDLNLKNEDLGEISGSRELKITNKRYKVLYYLIKKLTDSLSEDFKEILGYFYLNENDFDKFFKAPLNKYNTTDKLDNKVFEECSICVFYIKFIKYIFFKLENFLLNKESLL